MSSLWDDFTNIVADVVTLGAVSKVENSVADFNSAKRSYDKKTVKLNKLVQEYLSDRKTMENELRHFKSKHKEIQKLNSNKEICNKLDADVQIFLDSISNDKSIRCIDKELSLSTFNGTINPNYAEDNIAATLATLVMGPLGIIGAHGSADDQVEENRIRRNKIIQATTKVVEDITTVQNEHGLIIKHREAIKIISQILKTGV